MKINIGELLKQIRISKDISQKELSRRLKVTPGNLSRIELGKVSPTWNTIEKILTTLEVEIGDFVTGNLLYEIGIGGINTSVPRLNSRTRTNCNCKKSDISKSIKRNQLQKAEPVRPGNIHYGWFMRAIRWLFGLNKIW